MFIGKKTKVQLTNTEVKPDFRNQIIITTMGVNPPVCAG